MKYSLFIFSILVLFSCSKDNSSDSETNLRLPGPEWCYHDCTFTYVSQEPDFSTNSCSSLDFDFFVQGVDWNDGYFSVFVRIPSGYFYHSSSDIQVFNGDSWITIENPFRKYWTNEKGELVIQTDLVQDGIDYEENFLENGFRITFRFKYQCNREIVTPVFNVSDDENCDFECRNHYNGNYYKECMENCTNRRSFDHRTISN